MIARGEGPSLGPIFKPLDCSGLKDQGVFGGSRPEIVGIDTYFIKIGQSRPEIWPFVPPENCENASVPAADEIPYKSSQ